MSQVENPFDQFDQSTTDAIDGLIHLGELTKDVEFCGHTFGLRTLRIDDDLAASKVVEDFRGTIKEADAWTSSQVALALTHIDGEEDFCPQAGPSKTAFARARFQYITSNWFQPTIDYLFTEYAALLEKQALAIRAVQDLSDRSRPTSLPSPDSLIEPGTFKNETDLEIPNLP